VSFLRHLKLSSEVIEIVPEPWSENEKVIGL